jgi:hypothetical protein
MIRVSKVGETKDAVKIGKDAGLEVRSIAGDKFKDYAEANQVVLDATAAEIAAAKAAKAGMTL